MFGKLFETTFINTALEMISDVQFLSTRSDEELALLAKAVNEVIEQRKPTTVESLRERFGSDGRKRIVAGDDGYEETIQPKDVVDNKVHQMFPEIKAFVGLLDKAGVTFEEFDGVNFQVINLNDSAIKTAAVMVLAQSLVDVDANAYRLGDEFDFLVTIPLNPAHQIQFGNRNTNKIYTLPTTVECFLTWVADRKKTIAGRMTAFQD